MNLGVQLCHVKIIIYYLHDSILLKISHRLAEADFSISVVMLSNPFLNVWILVKTRAVSNKNHHNSSDHTQKSQREPTDPEGLSTVHTRWRDIIAARSAYRYNEYIGKTNCLCKPALKRKLLLVIAYFKSN